MGLLSAEELNHIRSSVDIIDIIGGYLPLTQRGKNYFGVCPFHDDSNPSMSVSKTLQIYTCFSCGATGNVFKFLMDYEHISFIEAVKKIADIGGVAVDIHTSELAPTKNKILYEIYETSQKFYQNNINTAEGKEAREYLHQRQISEEVIKEFGIGLSLKKRDLLTRLLEKKAYPKVELEKSGLLVKNEYEYMDIYYNRIMFPLYDLSGKVVGYSGRIYNMEDTAKYINTRETEIFKKGELLYNYHRAKDEARKTDTIIIVEGFMDVIRAFSVGIINVVATMGTAVTKQQANLIKRMARNVILVFDGDSAGEKATFACSNELMNVGVVPKIVRLEDKLDPDDYIKKQGKEKFVEQLENPISVMDFKLSYYKNGKNLQEPEEIAKYISQMITELNKIDDEILRELTLKKISEESNLDIDFIRSKLENKPLPVKVENMVPKPKRLIATKYEKAETYLLYFMLKSKEVIAMYHMKVSYLPTERYRLLAREIYCYYRDTGDFQLADFITHLEKNQELINTIGEIESMYSKETYTLDEIDDYIKVIRDYMIDNEWNKLNEQLKKETDKERKKEIGQRMMELKVRRDERV